MLAINYDEVPFIGNNYGVQLSQENNNVVELEIAVSKINSVDIESIYTSIFKNFFAYAYMLNSSKDEAHDLVQTVFARLLLKTENRKTFNADNLEAYIIRSIRNEYINRKKKNIKRSAYLEVVNSENQSAEDDHLSSDKNNYLQKAIQELPTAQRACLTMHFYHEMSYDEIAAELGITSSSVRTHMQRAKEKLATKSIRN